MWINAGSPIPEDTLTTFGLERSARLDEMYDSSGRPLPDLAAAEDPLVARGCR